MNLSDVYVLYMYFKLFVVFVFTQKQLFKKVKQQQKKLKIKLKGYNPYICISLWCSATRSHWAHQNETSLTHFWKLCTYKHIQFKLQKYWRHTHSLTQCAKWLCVPVRGDGEGDISLMRSSQTCLQLWGTPPPWSPGNLKSRTTRVRSHSRTQCEGPVLLQTFSVVPLWLTGHEDPGQPHQQRHHQVDRHPRVEDVVLEVQWPAGQRGEGPEQLVTLCQVMKVR